MSRDEIEGERLPRPAVAADLPRPFAVPPEALIEILCWPYRIETEDRCKAPGCTCSEAILYWIVGPDDASPFGRAFGDSEEAETLAHDMNAAYRDGVNRRWEGIRATGAPG